MKCFEVVQGVLDETYDEVPGEEAERDAAIAEALTNMSGQYRNSLIRDGGPDFSDPVVRFAYVFRYVPAHAHWLYELITKSPAASHLFTKEKLRVSCVGGGPGSDLVGVLKYMSKQGTNPSIFCEIIDGCQEWKATWSDLAFNINWDNCVIHTDYVIQDVASRRTWDAPSKLGKADLVTLSFFVSEIYHLGDEAKAYLRRILHSLKPEAIVLFNDNNTPAFYDLFDETAEREGFKVLLSDRGDRKIYDRDEQISAVGHFSAKFDGAPRLTGNMAWRVLKKKP